MRQRHLPQLLLEALRSFRDKDLRWSYLVVAGLFVVGMVINLTVRHGWAVWPVVFGIGSLCMIHEAAERNGQGVPPLHVYAWFMSLTLIWLVGAMIVSALGPWIMIAAMATAIFWAGRSWILYIGQQRLVRDRRARRQCVHCGYPSESDFPFCEHCGEDPIMDPDRKPVIKERTPEQIERAREILTPTSPGQIARANEQELLDTRPRKTSAPDSP
jgi:hypothetical protein